jgi:hypothetical protein
MISVENLYWVLWRNLLQPHDLHCFYHYPWGTQNCLSQFEYAPWRHKSDFHHVVFGFDQEPIWDESLSKIYNEKPESWGINKWAKILANSEKSQTKKDVCRKRYLLDWYFFYHGFAALDWYRDCLYMRAQHDISNAYLCLNHIVNERRSYRISLMARLLDMDIIHTGSVSMHADTSVILNELSDPHSSVSSFSKDLILRNLDKMSTLPWIVDQVPVGGDLSARFGFHEYKLWQSSFMHIVNETVFYEPKLHLTEKIFKPIVAQRPFLLVAAPGNLAYLRNYGFKTFGAWIDESYDVIQDPDKRLDAIAGEIKRVQAMSLPNLRQLLAEMTPVLEHNRQHFFGRFKEIIVDEMLENFDTCIRIWNNGRVDDRHLPLHRDLSLVRQSLLA